MIFDYFKTNKALKKELKETKEILQYTFVCIKKIMLFTMHDPGNCIYSWAISSSRGLLLTT
jgi:hypothetical protein